MRTEFNRIEISDIQKYPNDYHRLYYLEINDRCYTRDFLKPLKTQNKREYKKIIKVLELLARNERVKNPNHVKPYRNTGIYEIISKRGHARISFFYDQPPDEDVICVLFYWKTGSDRKKQNMFLSSSFEIMNLYKSSYI